MRTLIKPQRGSYSPCILEGSLDPPDFALEWLREHASKSMAG